MQRVVPQPVTITPAGGSFALTAAAVIRTNPGSDQIGADLAAAVKKQTGLVLAVNGDDDPAETPGTILIDLQAEGTDPAIGTEGYQLDVTPTAVKLSADSAAGLFHGVQTLRQLLTPGAAGSPSTLPAGHITDFPRYAYRGAMLDVARHFFGVADVKSYIDAVALYKVNQLHLHLTDDQGWRLEVPAWPKLTKVGGSTQVGGGPGGFYTAADYKTIVDYAASRYVTVIPEIDMPGHVGAAVASNPPLSCDGRKHSLVTSISPPFDALCTTRESTYGFIDTAVGTAAGLTPGPYVAIGGDEAQALNQTQYNGFVKRAQDIVAGHGKAPMAWAEIAGGPLLPSTVAEYWNTAAPQPFVVAAAAKGTKLIMAPGDHAYLDQQYNTGFPLGLHWAGYVPVSKAYDWDPVTILPGVNPTSVLGVEATLFTETVKNLGDAETLAFPRLPAIAEIGWSTPQSHDWSSFSKRLGKQALLWNTLGMRYFRSPEVAWS
jgi:hexosaminidase